MIGRALPRPLPGGAMAFDLDGGGVLTLLPSTTGWLVRTEGPPPPVPFAGLAFLAGGATTLPPEDVLVARAPRRTPEAARAAFLRSGPRNPTGPAPALAGPPRPAGPRRHGAPAAPAPRPPGPSTCPAPRMRASLCVRRWASSP